jgi:hypothetical protein
VNTLLKYYLDEFQKRGECVLKEICNLTVPSLVLLDAYKTLPPIEVMPEKEKTEMKKYVIEMFPNKTVKEKLECCKIVYTVGSLL